MARDALKYFSRNNSETSHNSEGNHLPARLSAASTKFYRPSAFTRHLALRAVAACLLFAVFSALSATSVGTAQAQNNLKALLVKAREEENSENYGAAERTYKQALALAPEDLETLKRLGILEQTELKFDDSIKLLKQVLAIDPAYPGANFFLGVSYLGKNDFAQSVDSFERELKTPNPHPRSHYYLGLVLQSSGRIEEAISELNQCLTQNPKD